MDERLPTSEEFEVLVDEFAAEAAKLFEWPSVRLHRSGFAMARRKLLHAYEEARRRANGVPHHDQE